MHKEYNSALPTPTEADKIGRFGRHRYIGKTQISVISTVFIASDDNSSISGCSTEEY